MYTIRRIGMDTDHPDGIDVCRINGYDCFLLLFVKTKAIFRLNGKDTITEPNTLVLFNINSPHLYRSYKGSYSDDWIQFESDEVPRIPFDTPVFIGRAISISAYIQLIMEAFSRDNEVSCHLLLSSMLTEVSTMVAKEKHYGHPYADRLLPLRYEIYAHPELNWKIQTIADSLYISKTYFWDIYKDMFGISCGADIIAARIKLGKRLLLTEVEKSVTEIARFIGYNSPAHFSRQFKQITGLTPLEYRKTKLKQ